MDGVVQRMIADLWLAATIWFILIAVTALAVTTTICGVSWLKPIARQGSRAAATTVRWARPWARALWALLSRPAGRTPVAAAVAMTGTAVEGQAVRSGLPGAVVSASR